MESRPKTAKVCCDLEDSDSELSPESDESDVNNEQQCGETEQNNKVEAPVELKGEVHLQNASLAGGVAVGTIAPMIIQPWGAVLIGFAGGALSTASFKYIQRRRRGFPLAHCDAAAVLSLQNTKPKNESQMFNKETAETNRETAGENTNLATDIFRVQLTENKGSCKNL